MIKESEVVIFGHSSNYLHYSNLGYDVKIKKPFLVKICDLMRGSSVKVTTICSLCGGESTNTFKDYYIYTNGLVNKFFCIKCKSVKSEKTCIKKWGVRNPMQSEECRNILKKSIIKKYGVDHYSKTDEFKLKFKNTCNKRFGSSSPLQNSEVKNKIKNSIKSKYGVDYPMQSTSVKNKSIETCQSKYGVSSFTKTKSFIDKTSNTNMSRIGFNNPMKSDIVKKKVKESNLLKYGYDSISKTENFKRDVKNIREKSTLSKFRKLLSKEYDVISYSNEEFIIRHYKCGSEFKTYKGMIASRKSMGVCICTICNPVGVKYSSIESEVRELLDNNNIEYISGDRKILNGKEIDIYIPSHKLAIEVNGVFWHSELYKHKNYHLEKTLSCRDVDISLLHIWEDDWRNKKLIVKSIILNRLNLNKNVIFARKCKIDIVGSKEARLFLNENHIQGFSSSSYRIGLYHNSELVSIMTFGYRYTNGIKEFELIRFCNKIGVLVIGSASKLFKNFIKNFENLKIVTYADISMFSGDVYKYLNFKKVSLSPVNYFWVVNGQRKHRYNYSKKKLILSGYDKLKTEVEIMHERGYYRIFSCGQEKWIFGE